MNSSGDATSTHSSHLANDTHPPDTSSTPYPTAQPSSPPPNRVHRRLEGDARRFVIAAEMEVVSPDFGHLERTISAGRRELTAAGVSELPHVVVADSGYWHTQLIQR